ncbi:MAG: type II toxin-antitoxin system RelE/ParE family toxin [Candidatus Diapherotrites archaeon]|jgi:mRNA-degrading endonuclease RelE of RelBE toxin-antitoxin system|uniref:Type II toxin-antitoxin system RelE/ParE family toxin n=1 Tax=Candidatus Iainarchaeum sp. TaxID=3101447 RepID=A0A8T5GEN5_9ARCH|nr:type II toxin-antitoxin system RelE/ParE family toxin [Candidatus Diapherotrites archaeon]MBT7241245.1 type II toxin-antitoxin system RelE/ParE family toxin [Candidatus Diapherotrites archaeon]
MVIYGYRKQFLKQIKKMKDSETKLKIKKQIEKVIENPTLGKPMRYGRKGTRELYISPFRLAYIYIEKDNKIIFIEIYHKDEQ